MPDKLSSEAKELLRQFDAACDDSLNAVKNSSAQKDDDKDSKDGKKKKFWVKTID